MSAPQPELAESDKVALLKLARESIQHGLEHRKAKPVDLESCSPALQKPGAAFVTLTIDDELRGCIGTLESGLALASNVAHFAHAAAFSDSRFPPVTPMEFDSLHIHISILSPLEDIAFNSERELIQSLRPGIDGLLIEADGRRATFLPSVWEKISDPAEFLHKLKMKAGLSPAFWPPHLHARRYTTLSIE